MKVVAAVFARGGSKGLPRKNLLPLGGKALLVRAIESARSVPSVSRVVVSTDDPEIAAVARSAGAEVPFLRPAELATDSAPEWLAWQHLIRHLVEADGSSAMDVLLSVPTTSPLRSVDDLERCVAVVRDTDADVAVTVRPADRNPYFNMVTLDSDGCAHLVMRTDDAVSQRQSAPPVYDLTTVAYAARPGFVLRSSGLFEGKVRAVIVPAERAIDIDTALDFQVAECLLSAQRAAASRPATSRSLAELSSLRGRVALVTGGAGHLGAVLGDALAEAGAAVAIADVAEDRSSKVAEQLGRDRDVPTLALAVDLTRDTDVQRIPEAVLDRLGRLDILINCAALVGTSDLRGWIGPFEQQSVDTWRRALEINLTAPFALTQACAPALRAHGCGSVVNIGSIYGSVGPDLRLYDGTSMGNPAAYAASKGGLLQLTRWLATVLAPAIRVNAVSIGGIKRGQPPEFVERYCQRAPLGRMASEEDVKSAVAYLAADSSAYVTGQNLIVDGGFTSW